MNISKIIPEGWNEEVEELDINKIYQYKKENKTIQGIVEKCDNNYNLYVNLGNRLEGIIPRSEIEDIPEGEIPKKSLCSGKVNKYVQFKIKDINDEQIILSRKKVQKESLNYIKNNVKVGQTVTGIVRNIRQYGAFIEIGGGVVGLAHIEDLSVARIKTPAERLKIGQKVNIVVKSIEENTGRINLSYKEILGTFEDNIKNFSVGTIVPGIIRETEKNKNGIFIELAPNLVGMAEFVEGYNYGQKVNVYIKKIDNDKKKVKLLIKSSL